MSRIVASVLLATAACARAPMRAPADAPTERERAFAVTQESRAEELEQALSSLSIGDKAPDCQRACELVGEICELSRKICSIAARHGDDADLAARCAGAEQRCRRSQDRVAPTCSCEKR